MIFDLWGAGIAALGAAVGEVVRLRLAYERLASDMQSREEAGEDPMAHRRVRYPRYYAFSVLVYTIAAAAVAGLIGSKVPWPVHAYIGLSLPSFVGQVLRVAEPLVPGRISPRAINTESGTVDSTSVVADERPVQKVAVSKYRWGTSLYSYLTA